MGAKTYSAGTIFLQVVPVFGDAMDAIKRQAKDLNKSLGDDLERGGREAGERAGKGISEGVEKGAGDAGDKAGKAYAGHFETQVKKAIESAQREVDRLNFKTSTDNSVKDLDRIKRKLGELKDVDYTADFDAKRVLAQVAIVEATLKKLSSEDHEINISANLQKALADIEVIKKAADRAVERKRELKFGVNQQEIERELGAFERKFRDTAKRAARNLDSEMDGAVRRIRSRLKELSEQDIVDVKGARRELADLSRDLRAMAKDSNLDIRVRADAAAAYRDLLAFNKAASALDGREIDVSIDLDAGAAVAQMGAVAVAARGARSSLLGLKTGGDDAANSFRSFNAVILAGLTLIPGLIPIIAGLGGALIGLVPILGAVVGGLTSMFIGFSGIGAAVGALADVNNNAAKDSTSAANTMRSAAYAVADAERSLSQARTDAARANADAARSVGRAQEQAARAVEAALERQADAEKALADAQRDATRAQEDLREARRLAKQDLLDLENSVTQNQLDEDQGVIDLFNAQVNYNATQNDGAATTLDKEQSRIALEQAKLRLKEIREEQKELAKEKKKADKEGVDGTARVETAQDALVAALERQKDAQEAVGDAAKAVNQARIDGARSVADAVRAQRRTEESGARSVASAQRSLARAQESYRDALVQTEVVGSASMQKLEEAMGKLGPAGRHFARFIFGLRDEFYLLRDAIQAAMLPPIEYAINTILNKYGPRLSLFLVTMGATVGTLFASLADEMANSPAWDQFFNTIQRFGPSLLLAFGEALINWMTYFVELMNIVSPYAERLAQAMLAISERAAAWIQTADGTRQWQEFMDYAAGIGPELVAFFGALVDGSVALGKALAPWGEMVLTGLTGILNFIADMDPALLGTIASSIIGIAIAFQLAVGSVAALNAGAAAFSSPLSKWILLIGIATTIIVALYQNSETFRDLVDRFGPTLAKVAAGIGAVVLAMKTWKLLTLAMTKLQPMLALVTGAVSLAQKGLLLATIRTNAAFALAIARQKAMIVVTKAWAVAQALLNFVMSKNPIAIAIKALLIIGGALIYAYKNFEGFRKVVDAVVGAIVGAFQWLAEFVVEDALPAIGDGMERAGGFFSRVGRKIWAIIKGIGDVFKWLWKNAIKPVLTFVVNYWKASFLKLKAFWEGYLSPVLQLIGKVVWELWKLHFKVALVAILGLAKVVFLGLKWAWDKILWPVFKLIGKVVGWLWDEVFEPVLGWIADRWKKNFAAMKVVWNKVLKPVFEYIGDKALPKLKGAFERAVDAIKRIWDGLKKVVGTPIKFVIEKVLNGGIIKGFNKIAKFVGTDEMKEIPVPEWTYAKGGVFGGRFAGGGVMPGYTPGKDVHHFTSPTGGRLHLSGGESILRPEITRILGEDWVHGINGAAVSGGQSGVRRFLGVDRAYYNGGVIPLSGASSAQHTSGYRGFAADLNYPGYADYGAPVKAWRDGRVAQMRYVGDQSYGRWVVLNHADNLSSLYAHLSNFGKIAIGQGVKAGQTVGYVGDIGNTGNPPTSHLHFEINGGNVSDFASAGAKGTGKKSVRQSFPGWLINVAKDPLGYVKGLVSNPIDSLKERFGGGGMVDMVAGLPTKLASKTAKAVWNMVPGPVKGFVGGAKKAMSWVGGVGEDVVGGIKDGLGAIAGAITPGGGAEGGDGFAGAAAEYAKGGVLPYNGTMKYDSGGYLPPGLTSVVNLTGRPEPVFTADQFSKLGTGEGGQTFHYEPHFEGSDLTAADVASDLNRAARRITRRGKYAGVN